MLLRKNIFVASLTAILFIGGCGYIFEPLIKKDMKSAEELSTLGAKTPCRFSNNSTCWFAGYEWLAKSGDNSGPNSNNWSNQNAWVDENGYLHLKITKNGNKWYSAEVWTVKKLGFGQYQFYVIGRIDQLDPNVVLGMFNYTGPDGAREIDIEIARWGNPSNPNLNYSAYPKQIGKYKETTFCNSKNRDRWRCHREFHFLLNGTYTTHRFNWSSKQVSFQNLHGHRNDNKYEIASWTTPSEYSNLVPQDPMPVHINLWLNEKELGLKSGKEFEIIIASFTYTARSY
jgi:hypothetical protein